MTNFSNNPLDQNDLDWLAFQYISNELSESESVVFENLLAQKQEAREALAAATQLVAGLKSIESLPTVKAAVVTTKQSVFETSPISSFRSQQWALVSCAAIVLLVTTFLLTKPVSHNTTGSQIVQTEPSQEDLEHVLDLWSESAEDTNITISILNSSSDSIDLIDQQNVLAENQPLEIPDWLYTAVSLPEESVN